MKRILLMLLVFITSMTLVACGSGAETYTCYDYLDTEYSFTYEANKIISINGVKGGAVVDTENQLILD